MIQGTVVSARNSCAVGLRSLTHRDPSSNVCGGRPDSPAHELADVLRGAVTLREAILELGPGLGLVPTFGLGGSLEDFAENALEKEPFVFEELGAEAGRLGYELVIYDAHPGKTRLERCVVIGSGEVISPLTPEYLSLDGVEIF